MLLCIFLFLNGCSGNSIVFRTNTKLDFYLRASGRLGRTAAFKFVLTMDGGSQSGAYNTTSLQDKAVSKAVSSGVLDTINFQDETEASLFEAEFVHKVYDVIAPHFSNTRHSPWPKVAEFLLRLEPGALIADVGCGNGKYLGINARTLTLGSDRSAPLAALAAQHGGGQEVCVADNLNLPYRDSVFDAVLSIAVLHHLSRKGPDRTREQPPFKQHHREHPSALLLLGLQSLILRSRCPARAV